MRSNQFVPDDALLRGVERIRHIPCAIVQGKYDLLCPPITAVALHSAWPESTLQIIEDAGHSAFEPGIRAALVAIMDGRRTTYRRASVSAVDHYFHMFHAKRHRWTQLEHVAEWAFGADQHTALTKAIDDTLCCRTVC